LQIQKKLMMAEENLPSEDMAMLERLKVQTSFILSLAFAFSVRLYFSRSLLLFYFCDASSQKKDPLGYYLQSYEQTPAENWQDAMSAVSASRQLVFRMPVTPTCTPSLCQRTAIPLDGSDATQRRRRRPWQIA
jgi:hypothetical protein